MQRRHLFRLLGALPASAAFPTAAATPVYRAAIIGHSGRGNYGHRIEHIFRDRPGITTVGVADGGEKKGRDKVCALYPGAKPYADFHEMLTAEKPDLVAVCPRWTDQHHAMSLAALQAGAHVFSEKPFTRTLAEADELLAMAREKDLKIAVAHQMLVDPNIQRLTQAVREGKLLGDLQQIHVFGKMDHRAGAEDLIVLGTHLFDMVRWFADSEATACSAEVLDRGGRPISRDQTYESKKENLGPLAGRQIFAQFEMANGIDVTYTSRAALRNQMGGWGFELVGAKTSARIFLNHPTRTYLRATTPGATVTTPKEVRWPEEDDAYPSYSGSECMDAFNRLAVDDWLACIGTDRDPICSGQRAMKSLEMIQAVFWAGLQRERIALPLAERGGPFD